MPNIARPKPRPPVAVQQKNRTKILLVRQPVKSVRRSDEPDRTVLHLVIGAITAVGIVGVIWLMGYLGFRLGFAPLIKVPDLSIDVGGGILTGTMMLINMPQVILQAGIDQPMWLMIGFAMIAIPAASLGAIKPRSPGGPKPKLTYVIVSYTGAIIAMLNGIALIWWTASPFRSAFIAELPVNPVETVRWVEDLQNVAGLDVLGTITAALWVVVTMRLAIPMWLKGLSASACFFTLVVVTVAMSMSNATVSQLTGTRSVCRSEDGTPEDQLILGFTPQSMATLRVAKGETKIRQDRDMPAVLEVVSGESIVQFLRSRAPKPE